VGKVKIYKTNTVGKKKLKREIVEDLEKGVVNNKKKKLFSDGKKEEIRSYMKLNNFFNVGMNK
jgi:uncharacterized protein YeeX (DUF496 family)